MSTSQEKKLTDKQRVFVEEYLKCWNAAEAARRAGYSAKTARSVGHENLTKPDILVEIQCRIAELKISADEVLLRLGEQARGDLGDFVAVTKNGQPRLCLKRAKRLGLTRIVKKLKADKDTGLLTEIELHDSQAALVHLGKHHKLFNDNVPEIDRRITDLLALLAGKGKEEAAGGS